MERRIRSIVFDLDGTLIDSHRDIARALNEVLEGLGLPRQDPNSVKRMVGGGVETLLRRAIGEHDHRLLDAARARFRSAYEGHLLDTTTAYEGVIESLRALDRDGFKIAIATNKPSFFTARIVDALGFDRAGVRAFASADETKKKKPDPSVLALALERARAPSSPEQVVYIGDMPVDVDTARAFGCPIVGVAWGFDPEGLKAQKPDAWVSEPAQLIGTTEWVGVQKPSAKK